MESALALCFLMTRAPATKERTQRINVIMLFGGEEFDADERAEVGGGLRFGKLDDERSAAAELFKDGLGVTEDSAAKFLRVCDD